DRKKESSTVRMSDRTGQASALCLVGFNQSQDLGLKCILRAVNGSDRLSELLLFELFLNRQAKFSEFFDISPRMKLQFLKFGENCLRLLKLRWFYWLSWLCNLRLGRAFSDRCRLLIGWNLLILMRRSGASFRRMLLLMMLLLTDPFGVRDVSWISHQPIDGCRWPFGCISRRNCSRHQTDKVFA